MARTGVRIADAFVERFIQDNIATLVEARVKARSTQGTSSQQDPKKDVAEVLQEVISTIAAVNAES